MSTDLSAISLFSGAMGLDLGLEQAGIDVRVCQDIDPIACATVKFNRPDLKVLEGDIRSISTEEILKAAGLKRRSITCSSPGSTLSRRKSLPRVECVPTSDEALLLPHLAPRFQTADEADPRIDQPRMRQAFLRVLFGAPRE